jgi:hypothetical protein
MNKTVKKVIPVLLAYLVMSPIAGFIYYSAAKAFQSKAPFTSWLVVGLISIIVLERSEEGTRAVKCVAWSYGIALVIAVLHWLSIV